MRGGWDQTLTGMNHHKGVVRRGASFSKLMVGLNIHAYMSASRRKLARMTSPVEKPGRKTPSTPHHHATAAVVNKPLENTKRPSVVVYIFKRAQIK